MLFCLSLFILGISTFISAQETAASDALQVLVDEAAERRGSLWDPLDRDPMTFDDVDKQAFWARSVLDRLATIDRGALSRLEQQTLDNPEEQRMQEFIEQHFEDAVSLLERVVNINSGSLNAEGVREVGRVFQTELDELGFDTRWITFDEAIECGGHLFAERKGLRGKRLLLIGHIDTVFEKDSPFQRFEREGDRARGPGVEDMKGGDVVIVLALQALHHIGALEGAAIRVALIGDEEQPGGPIEIVRGDLIDAGKNSDVALGFEPAVGHQHVTIARRGFSNWTLRTRGKRGHSGQVFSKTYGSGAIFEAARILSSFHKRVRGEQYLTFNPGTIVGGTAITFDATTKQGTAFGKSNVISQAVTVNGDLRFISEEQKERARAKMREIVESHLPETSAEIVFEDEYPAMEPKRGNYELLELFDQVSRDLGYEEMTPLDPGLRGAADISFVASFVDALSGLGPVGDGAHSTEEWLDLKSIEVAAARAAVLMYRLTR
jgi:glutamate carboxypeptidase